jgi:hypothetical protein
MRSVVTALLLFLAAALCHAQEDPNYVYAVNLSGDFSMTRYAKADHANTLRWGRPDCVVVNWAYEPKGEGNADELKRERERASEAIAAELEKRPGAAPAAVTIRAVTGLWVIYAGAGQEVAQGLEERLRSLSQSKFRVRLIKDPEWKVFANYVKQLREKQ